MFNAYHAATTEDNKEALYGTGGTDDPCQTNKEDHTEDILNTRKEDTNERSHPCSTLNRWRFAIRIGRSWNRVAIVRQAVEKCRSTRPDLDIFLKIRRIAL